MSLYHYGGSLTTPDCKEYVQWLVLDEPLKISKNGLVSINLRGPLLMTSTKFSDFVTPYPPP